MNSQDETDLKNFQRFTVDDGIFGPFVRETFDESIGLTIQIVHVMNTMRGRSWRIFKIVNGHRGKPFLMSNYIWLIFRDTPHFLFSRYKQSYREES